MENIIIFFCSIVFSLLATGMVRIYAQRKLIDIPNERSSHESPTPRGGGVAIVLTTILGSLLAILILNLEMSSAYVGIITSLFFVAILGFIDDHKDLSGKLRLGLHFILLAIIYYLGGVIESLSILGYEMVLHVSISYAVFITLGVYLLNITNFMDGIDGLTASQAVVMGLSIIILDALEYCDNDFLMVIAYVSCGSCIGFLFWNWPRAKIFMGDVGSTFLGALFALIVYLGLGEKVDLSLLLLPLLPFLTDATLTILRRLANRENIMSAHRTHLYQRMAQRLGRHAPVTLVYIVLGLMGVGFQHLVLLGYLNILVTYGIWLLFYGFLVIWCKKDCAEIS